MQIKPIQQRAGNAVQILPHLPFGTGTFPFRVPVVAAGTGVHGSHQHKRTGIGNRSRRTGDGNFAILQRLPHDLQCPVVELCQFVQKQQSVMGKGNLPRTGHCPAAHQSGSGNGVVRRTERAACHQRVFAVQQAGNGIDLRGFHGLRGSHCRQDRRDPLGKHALAAAGAADHQGIVPACCGNFQGVLCILLSLDIGKVQCFLIFFRLGRIGFLRTNCRTSVLVQVGDQFSHAVHTVHRYPCRGSFRSILRRHIQFRHAVLGGKQCHRQHTADRTPQSGQGNFPDKTATGGLCRNPFHAHQNPQQNRQIVHSADFLHVRRSQIHCDQAGRKGNGQAGQSRTDSFPTLPHRGIRQTDNFHLRFAAVHADFYIYRKGIQPEQS